MGSFKKYKNIVHFGGRTVKTGRVFNQQPKNHKNNRECSETNFFLVAYQLLKFTFVLEFSAKFTTRTRFEAEYVIANISSLDRSGQTAQDLI